MGASPRLTRSRLNSTNICSSPESDDQLLGSEIGGSPSWAARVPLMSFRQAWSVVAPQKPKMPFADGLLGGMSGVPGPVGFAVVVIVPVLLSTVGAPQPLQKASNS